MNYPNLDHIKRLSVDIETHDPELLEHGPGVYRKDGHILGVAISDGENFKEYYNFGHEDGTKAEKDANKLYVKHVLSLPCEKVFANGLYDIDWLQNGYDYKVSGLWHDVQIAEPLLDENRYSYSLDKLSQQYLNLTKQTSIVDQWCIEHGFKGDSRKHLWRMPYSVVREYAIGDADQTIKILEKQLLELDKQELIALYNIEMGCIPLLLKMRKIGVRINREKLSTNINYIQSQIAIKDKALYNKYGTFNYKSLPQTKEVFQRLNIPIPLNTDGKESFDKGALNTVGHPIAKEILDCRAMKTALSFLINSFHSNLVGDRIHCSFNPLRSNEYGTVSGRLSGANPNLQQVKHIDNNEEKSQDFEHELGVLAREIFIPEINCDWVKFDYSQIEYRFIAHYADGPRADEIRGEYNDNPETDYHKIIMAWTGLERAEAKRLNFGMAYSMGAAKFAHTSGWSIERAKELIDKYHKMVPFVKYTSRQVLNIARVRDMAYPETGNPGYIKTILGRRARISPSMREEKREYSLFNRLIQGSAADEMKKAMYDAYNKGLFNVLFPHLTVHDELDVSAPKTKEGEEATKELKHTMENAIKLKVPVIVKTEIGPDWAHLTEREY